MKSFIMIHKMAQAQKKNATCLMPIYSFKTQLIDILYCAFACDENAIKSVLCNNLCSECNDFN